MFLVEIAYGGPPLSASDSLSRPGKRVVALPGFFIGAKMEIDIAGYIVKIDDSEAEQIAAHHWTPDVRKGGRIYFKSRNVFLHRFIMKCEKGDGIEIDHISGNTLDNRRINLRRCSHAENQRNQRRRRDNRTGFKGVSYHKASGKYQAQITVSGKQLALGLYKTPEEAHAAYCEASAKYHREFGRTA